MRERILLATRSAGKLRELLPLFAAAGYDPVDLGVAGIRHDPREEELERFDTFEDNALAKAKHFYAVSRLPTVADDSGLCVDALGGAPGVNSKRWSGRTDLSGQLLDDANNALLLSRLANQVDRRARYVCAAAFVDDERELVTRGETSGSIGEVARGTGGFGYDPYFVSTDLGGSFGEHGLDAKERVSHRGRAMRALVAMMVAGR